MTDKSKNNVFITLDIETLPSTTEIEFKFFEKRPTIDDVPEHGSLKDAVRVKEYKEKKLSSMISEYYDHRNKAKEKAEEELRKEALVSYKGRIFCICYAKGDGEVQSVDAVSCGGEKQMLEQFLSEIKGYRTYNFCGQNVAFDLMFLFHRSLAHGLIELANIVRRDKGYSKDRDFDTQEMAGAGIEWKYRISLDNLCSLLNVPTSKDSMNGREVFDYYVAERYNDIIEYCKKDVIATRECYKILK